MAEQIQPSTDARATAIAVAYAIAQHAIDFNMKPQDAREAAKLVAELSREILAGTSTEAMRNK